MATETRLGWPRWRRSWWYHATYYAQTWRGSVVSTVLFPIFYLAAVKWIRSYHAAAATPLEPHDILMGKLSWVVTRAFATGVVYTIIIGSFGALQSWWSLTLPFIGALVALAFSAPLVAFAARSQ